MSQDDVVDLARLRRSCGHCSLHQLCLPAGISGQELEQLDEIVRKRRPLARNERLFHYGDALGSVYVARDGAFKTISVTREGDETVVGFHLPGELIGLDALADGQHRCEAIALVDSIVCEIPFERLTEVASHIPGLQQQLMRVIGRSLGRDQDHMAMLLRRQAHERLAMFLVGLRERLGVLGQRNDLFRLPMSREDIAAYLGLALETVSRSFGRLQDDGMVHVHGRSLEVLNPAALHACAHGEASDEDARCEGRPRA
jgi:CRP/FNR family transcriptional regulator, anaerobic regulatory protein